jgi:hypothetical protein
MFGCDKKPRSLHAARILFKMDLSDYLAVLYGNKGFLWIQLPVGSY